MISDHDWLLRTLQELNREIYGVSDDRRYGLADIISYVHRHITQIIKNVRKVSHKYTPYHLCSAFSWMMAYANRMHIDVVEAMWKCFPNRCPYCAQKPCACKQRGENRCNPTEVAKESPIKSLGDWQKTLADIYPENTLLNSAMHLAEEIGELSEASRNYRRACDKDRLSKVTEEVVDIFANLLAVSNCMNLDLASALASYFSKGHCPKCKTSPCECDYVEFDEPMEILM